MTTQPQHVLDLGAKITLGFVAAVFVFIFMFIGGGITLLLIGASPEPEWLKDLEAPYAMEEHLVPSRQAADIRTLLKTGSIVLPFHSTISGTAIVEWIAPPLNVDSSKEFVVATGRSVFGAAPATQPMRMRLTSNGRELLQKYGRRGLAAITRFYRTGHPPEARQTVLSKDIAAEVARMLAKQLKSRRIDKAVQIVKAERTWG
jgi:hypothetical protein